MRKLLFTSVAISVLAAAQPCRAGGKPRVYNDYKSLFAAAKASGRPVIIVYYQKTTCPICIGARDYILKNHLSGQIIHRYFEVAEIQLKDGRMRLTQYRNQFKGNYYPYWVIATPDGEFIDGGDSKSIGTSFEKNWRKRVAAVGKKHPQISKKNRKKIKEMLDQAGKDMQAGDYKKAYKTGRKLEPIVWWPKNLKTQCRKLMKDITDQLDKEMAQADELTNEKKPFEAALGYDRIIECFPAKFPQVKQAGRNLRNIYNQHDGLAKKVKLHKDTLKAASLLQDASQLEKDDKLLKARSIYYRVAHQYKHTPSGEPAKHALQRIDAAISKKRAAKKTGGEKDADQREAKRLVQFAKGYRAANMPDDAAKALLECVTKYPNTTAGAEARKLMIKWNIRPPK